MHLLKHAVLFALAAITVFSPGCAGSDAVNNDRVGLVISGSANDGGWNESAAVGLNELAAEGAITSMTQNVAPANEVAALEVYARLGYTYVIAHGFEYTDAVRDVSTRHPNVKFIQTNGNESGPNWRSAIFSDREKGYIRPYGGPGQSDG